MTTAPAESDEETFYFRIKSSLLGTRNQFAYNGNNCKVTTTNIIHACSLECKSQNQLNKNSHENLQSLQLQIDHVIAN